MKVKTVVCSSVGVKRKINQDNFYVNGFINENQKKYILKSWLSSKKELNIAVCDGMGGERHGEIASYIAVKKLAAYKERYSHLLSRFDEHVFSYVQSANNAICTFMGENNGERSGSTVALLCISPEKQEAVAANMGDTKVFYFHNGRLKKISEDHNQAQSLVNMGLITEEEALTHKDKSKLTQHLGIFEEEMHIEPYISDNIMIHRGDMFLVCSDGLTDMLGYEDITNYLNQKISGKRICRNLVDEANKRGGKDNITVILAEII